VKGLSEKVKLPSGPMESNGRLYDRQSTVESTHLAGLTGLNINHCMKPKRPSTRLDSTQNLSG